MLSAPQGHRSVDLPKEEGVTGGHLGTGCSTDLAWLPVASLGLERAEQNGDPDRGRTVSALVTGEN